MATTDWYWKDEQAWAFLVGRDAQCAAESLFAWAENGQLRNSKKAPDPAAELGKLWQAPIPSWGLTLQEQLQNIRDAILAKIPTDKPLPWEEWLRPGRGAADQFRDEAADAITTTRSSLDIKCQACFDLGKCLAVAHHPSISRLPSLVRELKWVANAAGVPIEWLDDVDQQCNAVNAAADRRMQHAALIELQRCVDEFGTRLDDHLKRRRDGTATRVAHSPDFRWVTWFGTDYQFTPTQAHIVATLWKAWRERTYDVGHSFLLDEAGSEVSRLLDAFKKHPAWKTMIIEGTTKGTARLASTPDDADFL